MKYRRFFAGLILGWVMDHASAWAGKELTGWVVEMEVEGTKVSCVSPILHETQKLMVCEGKFSEEGGQ
jgi:hypothetical protein